MLHICSDAPEFAGSPLRSEEFELAPTPGYAGYMGLEYVTRFVESIRKKTPAARHRRGRRCGPQGGRGGVQVRRFQTLGEGARLTAFATPFNERKDIMSDKIKVVVTDYIEDNLDWEAEELAKHGCFEFEAYQLKFKPEEEVLEKIRDADVILVNMVKMTESLLSKLEKCRLLIRHGIGYDNVDVDACTRLGIQFAYQPDYCKIDVAEHAIALIFACARKVVWGRRTLDKSSADGQWDFSDLFPIYRLEGKTLGIVGVGRIGSRVYLKLRSFGFNIIGCDPYLPPERIKELGIQLVPREDLFRAADYITVHTPLNDETRHLVNATSLEWMKPTAYLVNTSRGPMVDHEALADALRRNRIAGAAIDVYDVEPPPLSYPLFGLDNAILSPHSAWASEEAGWEIRQSILDDMIAFSEGRDAPLRGEQGNASETGGIMSITRVNGPLPGPKSKRLIEEWHQYEADVVGYQAPIVWESGKGCVVTDVDGNTYIDWTSGVCWSPTWAIAIPTWSRRPGRPRANSSTTMNAPTCNASRRPSGSSRRSPPTSTNASFLSTGSEVTEAAARLMKRRTGNFEIISFEGGFHGRTSSAATMGGMAGPKRGYGPTLPGAIRVPYPNPYRDPYGWCEDGPRFQCYFDHLKSVVRANSTGSLAGGHHRAVPGRRGIHLPAGRLAQTARRMDSRQRPSVHARRSPVVLRPHRNHVGPRTRRADAGYRHHRQSHRLRRARVGHRVHVRRVLVPAERRVVEHPRRQPRGQRGRVRRARHLRVRGPRRPSRARWARTSRKGCCASKRNAPTWAMCAAWGLSWASSSSKTRPPKNPRRSSSIPSSNTAPTKGSSSGPWGSTAT